MLLKIPGISYWWYLRWKSEMQPIYVVTNWAVVVATGAEYMFYQREVCCPVVYAPPVRIQPLC